MEYLFFKNEFVTLQDYLIGDHYQNPLYSKLSQANEQVYEVICQPISNSPPQNLFWNKTINALGLVLGVTLYK